MPSFLNRLSIRNRIWVMVAILLGSIVLGSVVDILTLRGALWQEKEQKTRQLVESGYSVLTHFHDLQLRGELSQAQAQAAAIGTIKAMRYDETEYFWLTDLGLPYPKMVMHPTMPALDGQVLDSEEYNRAISLRIGSHGAFTPVTGNKNLFHAFATVVNQGGQGYVTYLWPKPKTGTGVTDELYSKVSYIRKFEPWGWLIGSGIYVDDVDVAVQHHIRRDLVLVSGVGIALLIFTTLVARSITRPLRRTVETMRAIGRNEDGGVQRLPVEGHGEIAELAGGFNDMLEQLKARDTELARHQEFLEETVTNRTAELRESESKFSSICTTAQDAIVMFDQDARISYWNPAAEKIFGYSPDQAVGHDLHELLAPERLREVLRSRFVQFRQTGDGAADGKTLELAGLRKDGSEFPMELSISTARLQGSWSAVCFVRDISERKRADLEIQESRFRMRALLDASDESVLLLCPDGKILAINAFGAQRFGQTPEPMVGKNFFDLIPPNLAETRRTAVQQVATTGDPMHLLDRRGSIFFNNTIYPVKDASGAVESVAVFAKDVTEQHCAKEVDDIFRKLDSVLLKWQMNLETIAQIFCDEILPIFELAAAWIGRAEKDGQLTLMASAEESNTGGLDALRMNPLRWDEQPGCCLPAAGVIRSGRRQISSAENRLCAPCNTVTDANGARAIICLPLTLRSATWGVLTLYGRDAHQFEGEPLLERLAVIATRLGNTLEAALQQEWLTLLDAALAGVDNAVFITDANANILWVNRAFTQLSGYDTADVLGKNPKLFSSGVQDAGFFQHFWQTIKTGGTWHGEIVNARRDGTLYTVHQTITPLRTTDDQVSHFVAVLEDITQRKAEDARIQHSAQFDLLTDLPNRALFFDRLGQALTLGRRDGQSGALLFLDLDHFKEVNDQLGHAAGDAVLVEVAARLRAQVRESDTVARLGGDEFTVILPSLHDGHDAVRVADNIIAAIGQAIPVAGTQAHIGVSIGIALFPQHGATGELLLSAADNAMYLAKNAGRNCYAFAAFEVVPPVVENITK